MAFELRHFDQALTSASVCIALEPQWPECFYNRAICQQSLNHNEEALADFQRAAGTRCEFYAGLVSAGHLVRRLGRFTEAERDLETALKHDSRPSEVYYQLACLHAVQNDPASAREYLRKSLTEEPGNTAARALHAIGFDRPVTFGTRSGYRSVASRCSKSATKNRLPRAITLCPSAASSFRSRAIPPGYFGFNSPPVFKVRQYGLATCFRLWTDNAAAASSAAAWAAIQAKIPVVIGQQTSTRCFFAKAERISLIVINFPFGTRRIIASTSNGAGITIMPVPQRFDMRRDWAGFRQPFAVGQFLAHDFRRAAGIMMFLI